MTTVLTRGAGEPVTVFAHGLGGGIPDTRPLGSGVAGTKVFYTAPGHDGVPVDGFGYRLLADTMRSIADEHGARQALGVSMGAGTLCRLLAQTPDRFDRVVFFLPAVLDEPRRADADANLARLEERIEAGDRAGIAAAVEDDLPDAARGTAAGRAYASARAATFALPSMRGLLPALRRDTAIDRPEDLATVTAKALVLGCHGDTAHPAGIARRLGELLPDATVRLWDEPDVVWTRRAELRELVAGFLSP